MFIPKQRYVPASLYSVIIIKRNSCMPENLGSLVHLNLTHWVKFHRLSFHVVEKWQCDCVNVDIQANSN